MLTAPCEFPEHLGYLLNIAYGVNGRCGIDPVGSRLPCSNQELNAYLHGNRMQLDPHERKVVLELDGILCSPKKANKRTRSGVADSETEEPTVPTERKSMRRSMRREQ